MRPEEESQGPVIRDKRRIDPATGKVRKTDEAGPQPGGGLPGMAHHTESVSARVAGGPGGPQHGEEAQPPGRSPGSGRAPGGRAEAAAAEAQTKLAERTADLQRLQAEYANYRKRVERDRMAVREQALANVLSELLPVLDDVGRAREHGELTGGFKSVGESLEGIVSKLGLTSFGESGDPFDPTLHEALMHSYSADVSQPTAVQILQPGYKVGERIIRPARVAVAEPGGDAAVPAEQGPDDAGPEASAGENADAGERSGEE